MSEPAPEAVEELARVKAQHRYVDVRGDYEAGDGRRYFGCSCGWTHDVAGMSGCWSWVEEHERHAARAVLAAGYVPMKDARVQVIAEAREAVSIRRDEVLAEHGGHPLLARVLNPTINEIYSDVRRVLWKLQKSGS